MKIYLNWQSNINILIYHQVKRSQIMIILMYNGRNTGISYWLNVDLTHQYFLPVFTSAKYIHEE